MKKLWGIVLVCIAGNVCALGTQGSGIIVTQSLQDRGFTAVDVGYGMKLNIVQGDFSVSIRSDDNIIQHVKHEKRGKTLLFFIETSASLRPTIIEVNISMPVLEKVGLSGGSMGTIDFSQSETNFQADLSGGSKLEGNLSCNEAVFSLSGGSSTELKGRSKRIRVDGSGGSVLRLKELRTSDTVILLSGGSKIFLFADGRMDATLSGGSELFYSGNPNIGNLNSSGGSSIQSRN